MCAFLHTWSQKPRDICSENWRHNLRSLTRDHTRRGSRIFGGSDPRAFLEVWGEQFGLSTFRLNGTHLFACFFFWHLLEILKTARHKIGSDSQAPGADPGFWSGGSPAEFWPQGAWAQNLLKIGFLSLKLAENCMILKKNVGQGELLEPPGPPPLHLLVAPPPDSQQPSVLCVRSLGQK